MNKCDDLKLCLSEKKRYLDEMLEASNQLKGILSGEDISGEGYRDIGALIETRDKCMNAVDHIDRRILSITVKSGNDNADAASHAGGDVETDVLRREIYGILENLVEIQQVVEQSLSSHRDNMGKRIGELRMKKRGIKGYYNQEIASRSRYIDDKK